MSLCNKNLPLKMVRPNLDGVPEFELPAGFGLRWYQPGDEAHWLRIHAVADRGNEITPELFQKQFCADEKRGLESASAGEPQEGINAVFQRLRERQCYLLDPRGEVIGTATAWFNNDFEGARWGRVHWVAIVPEFQGRSLSKPMLTAICRRLRELGHDRAYLSTSTARLAAIRLYLRFGFAPLIRNLEEDAVWRDYFIQCRPDIAK